MKTIAAITGLAVFGSSLSLESGRVAGLIVDANKSPIGWMLFPGPDGIRGMVGTEPLVWTPLDFNQDGFTNGEDIDLYHAAFVHGTPMADLNGDGFMTGDDYDAFLDAVQ